MFVATGAGPFELAVGREKTPAGAVALSTIASALGRRKLEDLPQAGIGSATQRVPSPSTVFGMALPSAPGRPALLWAVLVAGVLILATVAWSLLRQLKAQPPQG